MQHPKAKSLGFYAQQERRNCKMQKAIVYRAYNGMEIIDTRPEAEIAYSNMKYAEELAAKRKQRNKTKPHKSFAEILSALL
jgi:hypothetical protein